jgi:hypothetical protein
MAVDRPTAAWLRARLGHGELQASVRSGPVVRAHALAKHRLELTARHDEELVQAVLSGCPHPTLGERVGDWRLTGVRTTLIPAEAMTASKLVVNLVSRSRSENSNR